MGGLNPYRPPLAERSFKPRQFERVATRYDKLLPNYKGFVQIVAVAVLLR